MTIRLLLVDDHAVVRSGLLMLLATEEDVEIIGEAGTAAEALASAADLKPDVILMDIEMPIMDGIEAARAIRALDHYADIPIVAMTAHKAEDNREMLEQAGITGSLGKPIDPETMYRYLLDPSNLGAPPLIDTTQQQ